MSVFVITGASGFIGRALRRRLTEDGHQVRVLVRRPASAADEFEWDPGAGTLPLAALDGSDVVVNLAGSSISDLPWTSARRTRVEQSRLRSTGTLVDAIRKSTNRPGVLLSGSATGFYGNRPGEVLDEHAPAGEGFLAHVTSEWERAAHSAPDDVRVVTLRTGLVIGAGGGALAPLVPLTRFGLGSRIGSGRQVWPWIGLEDEIGAIAHLATADVEGPANLTAPAADTASQVTRALAAHLHRPHLLALPSWTLRAVLRDAADELLLPDQRVVPSVLQASGFAFADPTLGAALARL